MEGSDEGMSSVDKRIVEMQFDNKQFEDNVKTTMSTTQKLKEALHQFSELQSLVEIESKNKSKSNKFRRILKNGKSKI